MSEMPSGVVPEWDVHDRMRKALRASGAGVSEMAEYLDVNRNTVSNWINGRIKPSTQTLRLWALRCGVSFEWLAAGLGPTSEQTYRTPTGHSLRDNHDSTTPFVAHAA